MSKKTLPLYILGFQAENFKRISVLNMQFADGKLIQITGENGAGKSSTLDAILAALAGKRVLDSKPIQKGRKKGWIKLDLGDGEEIKLTIERSITEKGQYLKLTGDYEGTPQDFLDRLVSGLTFDPMAFAKKSAKEQAEVLLEHAGLKQELYTMNNSILKLTDDRRDVNRDLKVATARLEPYRGVICDDTIPDEAVNISEEYQKLATLKEEIKRVEGLDDNRESLMVEIDQAEERLKLLKSNLKSCHELLAETDIQMLVTQEEVLTENLATADTVNQQITAKKTGQEIASEVDELQTRSKFFTAEISDIAAAKLKLLGSVELPVEGMAIDEENGLTLNDIPFDQCATSEKIKISTALAMHVNPDLRTIFIRDGNDLDDANVAKIKDYAEALNYQVIMERIYKGRQPCEECKGTGKVKSKHCEECNGSGKLPIGLIFEIENGEIKE